MKRAMFPPTAASRTHRLLIWKHQIAPFLSVAMLALQAFLREIFSPA
jgi:hypothetical protein